jgi:hypothetical protein
MGSTTATLFRKGNTVKNVRETRGSFPIRIDRGGADLFHSPHVGN